jgi:hypothetical protein
LAQAFHQGKYFADIAKKLKGSQWFLFSIHKECCVCESHSVSSSYNFQQNKKLIEKERGNIIINVYVQYSCTFYLSQCIFKYNVVVNNKNLVFVTFFIEIRVGIRSIWCCFGPCFGSDFIVVNVFIYVSDTFLYHCLWTFYTYCCWVYY